MSGRYIWTLDEIRGLPDWGDPDGGWFYGLVRNHETGKVRLSEVYGGLGYSSPYLRTPRSWWQALEDVRATPIRKKRVGPPREPTFHVDLRETTSLSEVLVRLDSTTSQTSASGEQPSGESESAS